MNQQSAGPPKGADPEKFVSILSELPRPLSDPFQLRVRGKDVGEVVLRVLTAGELTSARIEAGKQVKAALGEDAKVGSLAYEEEYEQQKSYQIVRLALRQASDPQFPALPRNADIQQLTDDEVTVVCRAYNGFRVESGPMISEMTVDEMEAWFELLSKGFDRLPLARFSGEALIDLIQFLVSKLSTSPTGTSSSGSPPAGASTTRTATEGSEPEAPAPAET